jgi:hypothetical protein
MRVDSGKTIFIAAIVIIAVVSLSFGTAEAAIRIKTGSPKTALETYVINDAVGFLSKMFTDAIDTSGTGATFEIVIGTPQNNTLISQAITSGNIALPTGKYASLGYAIKTVGTTIYLAASSDTGISPGMYDLLQQYDAYFQISGEILPQQTAFSIKSINKSVAPAFRYSGLFPWDNFLDGMSGWNEEDFKLFIDRMVRLRFNFIEFHNYPGMAYYNETYTDGSPNSTSDHVADWVDSFQPSQIIGKAAFGTITTFGTRQWWQNKSRGNAVAQDSCQAMMRRVIDYAHLRGVQTVIGYCLMQPRGGNFAMTNSRGWEAMPDPLNANNANKEVDRYRRLVQIYPKSDYYWLWQAEAGGALWKNITNDANATALRNQYSYWVPDANKKGDIDYGYLFWQTVNKLTSAERSKIATGGWDMSNMFIGYDRDCPKEIIFHNMNSWDTRQGINQATNEYKLTTGRRTWMTDWWEYDGLAFFPQFRVKKQEKIYKGCVANNVECITLDGWKQSGVEHDVKYLSEFVWNPTLTGTQFYNDYCGKVYGSAAVSTMANFYNVNDSLEPTIPAATTGDYRDMNICEGWQPLQFSALTTNQNTVTNCQTLMTKQQAFIARNQTYSSSLKSLRPQLSAAGQYWLDLMINRLDFQILYVQSLITINKSYVSFQSSGKTAAIFDLNTALDQMGQAILKLSTCARNTSDLGLIGQINILDYNELKKFITSNGGVVGAIGQPSRTGAVSSIGLKTMEISVYDIDGRCVARQTVISKNAKIPLVHSGIYFIKVKDAAGNVRVFKKLLFEKRSIVAQLQE